MSRLADLRRIAPFVLLLASGCGSASDSSPAECTDDVCPCSEDGVRAAIAEGRGPYTFDCASPTTIRTGREIVIDSDVILDGSGNLTLDANGRHRVLSVPEGVTAELIGITVINGRVTEENGGGIRNEGALTLTACSISESAAGRESGCRTDDAQLLCAEGGGIWSSGTLTLNDSTVTGGSAHFGGGIANREGLLTLIDSSVRASTAAGCRGVGAVVCSGGGGIWSSGTMSMLNSTVSGSSADWGAGTYNRGFLTLTNTTVSGNSSGFDGGGLLNFETLTLIDSTVAGNAAGQSGGGVANQGGVLEITRSTLSRNTAAAAGGAVINQAGAEVALSNSTVSGNTAETGGGIYNGGALQIASSTMAENVAPSGSAIFDPGNLPSGQRTIRSTLIEGSCAGSTLGSEGYNVEGPGDTCGLDQATDRPAEAELGLGPLEDNGGPTDTHSLSASSAGADLVPESDCLDARGEPLTVDQRGEPRPAGLGMACDVGSFEAQP